MPLRIEFAPSDSFNPGEKVTGQVILECHKPIKANSLKVFIFGSVDTTLKRTKQEAALNFQLQPVLRTKTTTYRGQDVQINQYDVMWQKTTENGGLIKAGSFPFSFDLPSEVLPTFDGTISYQVSCKLEVQGFMNANMNAKKEFEVNFHVDLNKLEVKGELIHQYMQNTGMIFKNGMVSYKYLVYKQGFVAGEKIVIPVKVDNQSKKPVHLVRVRLTRNLVFRACDEQDVVASKLNVKAEVKCSIAPGTNEVVFVEMTCPAVMATMKSKLMDIDYYLYVGLESTSTFKGKMEHCTQVFIGTVPIPNTTEGQKKLSTFDQMNRKPIDDYLVKNCHF